MTTDRAAGAFADVVATILEDYYAHNPAEARRLGLPAYVILHDATLNELALRQPRDMEALALVPGIGARKLERYGAALIELVREPAS